MKAQWSLVLEFCARWAGSLDQDFFDLVFGGMSGLNDLAKSVKATEDGSK